VAGKQRYLVEIKLTAKGAHRIRRKILTFPAGGRDKF